MYARLTPPTNGTQSRGTVSDDSHKLPPLASANIPRPTESEITLYGNPHVGIVHHLAHHHLAAHGNDYDATVEGGQRFAAIIQTLQRLQVSNCFLESCEIDDACAFDGDDEQRLIIAFPSRIIPRRISDEQALLLAHPDQVAVIGYFLPDAKFYGTQPSDKRIARQAWGSAVGSELEESITFHYREVLALDYIMEVLGKVSEREAAIVYGSRHIFASEDIPAGKNEETAPLVIKYHFEPWSSYDSTTAFGTAKSAVDQLAIIGGSRRISDYAWRAARNSQVQLTVLPKLKADPDWENSPEELLEVLIDGICQDAGAMKVEDSLRKAYQLKSGPFADLSCRPGSEVELKSAASEFASIPVYDELHPFTQLQFIRRAPFLKAFCFGQIITKKGQLQALDKLVPESGETLEEFRDHLLSASASPDVRAEVLRRLAARESPFADFF